jgi:hypothetical protein
VVHVDVDVQHTRVKSQELQDGQHYVVDVAEARRLVGLCVMQPTRPVDGNVGTSVNQAVCAV